MTRISSIAAHVSGNSDRQPPHCHAVLRLPAAIDDPVRIIRAAQIQLRRWRREVADAPAVPRQRQAGEIVGEIIAARESLLKRSFDRQPPQTGVQSAHARGRSGRAGQRECGERIVAAEPGCAASLIGSAAAE